MSVSCPLCEATFAEQAFFVGHLADAHGLVDDAGTSSAAAPPVEPPVYASTQFAPLEPSGLPGPPPPIRPPPPTGWNGPSTPYPQLPPPPPSRAAPAVSRVTIALIVGFVLIVAAVAIVLVGGSSSTSTSRTRAPVTTTRTGETRPPEDTSPTSAAAPAPVMASSVSTTDSVDPVEARIVAPNLWNGRTDALRRGDTAALRVFDDGPLLDSDIGSICQVGCPPPTFSQIQSLTVNVPHQTGWPAMFFAAVTYADGCNSSSAPCVNQFVAVQADQGQPWKATLLIQYGGHTASMEPRLLPDGFAVAAADASSAVPPLLADFANYETALKTTGQKPERTNLEDGPFTSDLGDRMFEPPEQQRARGIIETTEYTVDPVDPVYSFASAGGGTTACGTIRYSARTTSADGSPLPAETSIYEWGLRLAEGDYRSMTLLGLHMVCFDVLPNEPAVFVIASWGGNVTASGERI